MTTGGIKKAYNTLNTPSILKAEMDNVVRILKAVKYPGMDNVHSELEATIAVRRHYARISRSGPSLWSSPYLKGKPQALQ
ncbi:hypothetical protein DPMN_096579 [Dreissena polymorpha]|uniref:Uncharacterized protein n=1 Tax=Dreissena polymorpha TaxID=45954 RepID=A0A9D4R5K0_DREPO|nr:hypothetical protein DPMN_096579 [Dreissena polymorpha]